MGLKTNAYVIVKCNICRETRQIYANELTAEEVPMCKQCYVPMFVTKAVRG